MVAVTPGKIGPSTRFKVKRFEEATKKSTVDSQNASKGLILVCHAKTNENLSFHGDLTGCISRTMVYRKLISAIHQVKR